MQEEQSNTVLSCTLCGALADLDPADHKGWRVIDGDLYCPDCWHICDGKSCGHRPEDGERCGLPNEKPRLSIECLTIGVRCPWMHPSVNAANEKGVVCDLPDEDGYACPRVQLAAREDRSFVGIEREEKCFTILRRRFQPHRGSH